ncbi:hypothetical protein HY947_04565 [Candidatus Gottesmanbacteria bacterium]|nr:hypothetical protein [Candidatus Gottesmanbacteria bacterium]
MFILGISNGHVATATLLKDGRVIASVSEERFNGVKNYNGFPKQAIDWCLKQAGISGRDLDLVTTPYLYRPPVHAPGEQMQKYSSLKFLAQLSRMVNVLREFLRKLRYKMPIFRFPSMIVYRIAAQFMGGYFTYKQKQYIAGYLGIEPRKVIAYDHHLSHAAAGYYASSFNTERTLVLTMDGEGDNVSASVSIFHGKKIQVLARTPREYSLGYLYAWITYFLGMKPHEHEYKVMGLAPYAKREDVDRIYKKIEHLIFLDPSNPLRFMTAINAQDFYFYLTEHLMRVRFDILAGAFQRLVEEITVTWVRSAIKKTGIHTVVLSGGVFMNVKANQRIAALPEVKKFFILPSCADETAPLGSCYLGLRHLTQDNLNVSPIENIYWGSEIDKNELEEVLNQAKKLRFHVERMKSPEEKIAQLVADGNVVANISGGMEFGARALGNRSLLADPSSPRIVREINMKMKSRDFWMPFAVTILWDRMSEYILNPKNFVSPYMMMTFDTTPKAQKELIAGLHPYDFTTRPQLLTKDLNPRYYRIIQSFSKITGIGAVLNTSFNLHGYPIVKGPREALYAFVHSGLTHLALEEYLITKID